MKNIAIYYFDLSTVCSPDVIVLVLFSWGSKLKKSCHFVLSKIWCINVWIVKKSIAFHGGFPHWRYLKHSMSDVFFTALQPSNWFLIFKQFLDNYVEHLFAFLMVFCLFQDGYAQSYAQQQNRPHANGWFARKINWLWCRHKQTVFRFKWRRWWHQCHSTRP